jgi:NAD(P)-dependent dehydrogenase (short-subunit alcohol dehydrogenase family)
MERSSALVTGATSGLGQAAARLLAQEGWSEIIVTGRTLARAQQTAAELAADSNRKVFTPLELDLDRPSSAQSALAELAKRGPPVDFLLLNAGMVPSKKRVLTATDIEASQAPLIGHHQLTVGLLGVRRAADRIIALKLPIAGVLNNAGIMQQRATKSAQGWDLTFATDHLGPFALTEALVPHLADGTNVIFVGSAVEDPERGPSARGEWRPGGSTKVLPPGHHPLTSAEARRE